MEKKSSYLVISSVLSLLVLFPLSAYAQDRKFALRLLGQASPYISGEAGNGSGAPGYNDALNAGLGIGAEASWRFSSRLSLLAGIGYENYAGSSHQGISFDDLKVVPVYLGGKFHLTPDVHRWDPYFRMSIGAAHLSSVDVSYQGLKGKYWYSSTVFLFDVGIGVEYRWNRWGASMEIKLRYLGNPDSAMGSPSNAGHSWAVPIVFGINYYF